jgi:hypothetical protein
VRLGQTFVRCIVKLNNVAFAMFGRKRVGDICMRAPKSRPKVIGSWFQGDSFRRNDTNGGCSLPSNQGACKCLGSLGSAC